MWINPYFEINIQCLCSHSLRDLETGQVYIAKKNKYCIFINCNSSLELGYNTNKEPFFIPGGTTLKELHLGWEEHKYLPLQLASGCGKAGGPFKIYKDSKYANVFLQCWQKSAKYLEKMNSLDTEYWKTGREER